MPPEHIATRPRRGPGRKDTNRAASVPAGRQENSRLESLRSRRQKISLLGVEDMPSPSSSRAMTARGRKRGLSSFTSLADGIATISALTVGERTADASEQHPRKRHKRSFSTPAASRSSQLSAQLQSRRYPRSRVGSPTTDVENIPRSRGSARLSCRIHPFIASQTLDIYTHLADPDGPGNLLSEQPASSVVLSTPNEIINPQSTKRTDARRRTMINLGDENVKRDLMEEWAQMRQSQGTLPFSGRNEKASLSRAPLHDDPQCDEPVSPAHPEVIIWKDPDLVQKANTVTSIPPQRTILDVSPRSTRMDFDDTFPVGTDALNAPVGNFDYMGSVLPPGSKTEQSVVPSADGEALPIPISYTNEDSPSDKPVACHLDSFHRPGSFRPTTFASPSRKDNDHLRRTESTAFPVHVQVEAMDSKDTRSIALLPRSSSLDTTAMHLDSDEEFYMLDIPEIFALPWVPVSSQLYVPPGLEKLISGMKAQLTMEARARKRAEHLYQTELNRRVSAEKVVDELRAELETRRDFSGKTPF